jgi:hypothetical protein
MATMGAGNDQRQGQRSRRRDVDARVAGLHLPASVVEWAKKVSRLTRLPWGERADVAVQLCEDAAILIHHGADEKEAIAAMGDPRQTAARLRRERGRLAPLYVRLTRSWLVRLSASVGVMLVLYGCWFVRFHAGRPTITRNYAAEFSAKVLEVPEAQRGVGAFKEAVAACTPEPMELKWCPTTSHPTHTGRSFKSTWTIRRRAYGPCGDAPRRPCSESRCRMHKILRWGLELVPSHQQPQIRQS